MKLIPIVSDLRSNLETKLAGGVAELNRLRTPLSVSASQDQWLSPTEAAEYAGLSKTTIWRWQKEGLASGRGGRVRRHDLDSWLAGAMGNDFNPSHSIELLKLKQAAERANVSRQTIWRWSNRGLKIQRHGRVVRIRTDILDEYLKGTQN